MNLSWALVARSVWSAVFLLVVACLAPSAVRAQSPDSATAAPPPDAFTLQFLSDHVPRGKSARLVTPSGMRIFSSLTLLTFTPAGVLSRQRVRDAADVVFEAREPWSEIDRIDLRQHSARRGAVVGGVSVGLLSIALGALVASDPFLGSGGSNGGEIAAVGAIGALTGAGVGALIGTFIPRWATIYRRGEPSRNEPAKSWSSRGARRP